MCVWCWTPRSPLQQRDQCLPATTVIQYNWPGTGCNWKSRSPLNHLGNSVRKRQTWHSPEARKWKTEDVPGKENWGRASSLWYIFNVYFVLPFALLYWSCYMDTTHFLWPFHFLFFIFLPVQKFNSHVRRLKQCSQIHCVFHVSWSWTSKNMDWCPHGLPVMFNNLKCRQICLLSPALRNPWTTSLC